MELKITDQAKELLNRFDADNHKLLLSLDDGVGPYSDVGNCSLDMAFNVVLVKDNEETPNYDQKLTDSDGNTWHYKGYSQDYLDENMKLDVKDHRLILSGDSGVIDSTVSVKKA